MHCDAVGGQKATFTIEYLGIAVSDLRLFP